MILRRYQLWQNWLQLKSKVQRLRAQILCGQKLMLKKAGA